MDNEKKLVYPALFTFTEDAVLVEISDLEILTGGKDLYDAIQMARDAIELVISSMEDFGDSIPESSESLDITSGTFSEYGSTILSYVDVRIKPDKI